MDRGLLKLMSANRAARNCIEEYGKRLAGRRSLTSPNTTYGKRPPSSAGTHNGGRFLLALGLIRHR